jgi:hypothetical protein
MNSAKTSVPKKHKEKKVSPFSLLKRHLPKDALLSYHKERKWEIDNEAMKDSSTAISKQQQPLRPSSMCLVGRLTRRRSSLHWLRVLGVQLYRRFGLRLVVFLERRRRRRERCFVVLVRLGTCSLLESRL